MRDDDIIHASGDLFPTVAGLETSKGVAMNPPPTEVLGDVTRMIENAVKAIPAGSTMALVGVATKTHGKVNTNLVFAARLGEQVTILSWIGKTWGQPIDKGVAVQWHR